MARTIEQRTGFHRGEVEGVLIAMAEVIFQTALTSEGCQYPEEVTPEEVSVSRMYFVADRKLNKRLKEEQCHRIPFHYYFLEELLTRELLEKDGKLSDEMETGE